MAYDGIGIAERIIQIGRTQAGLVDELTPLKLQKILFYAQGWYAANCNKRLFEDDIYAWQYGPVVIDVYEEYKSFGSTDLLKASATENKELPADKETDAFLTKLLGVYGNMSAYELVARTHKEEVWIKNWKASNKLMPFEDIKKAFKMKLVES